MFRSLRNKKLFFSILLPAYLLLTFSTGKGMVLCLEEDGKSRIEAALFKIYQTDFGNISNICIPAEICSESSSCSACLDIPLSVEAPAFSPATYQSLGIKVFYTNLPEKYSLVQWENLFPYNHFEIDRLFHHPRLTSIRTIVLLI